MGQGHTPGIVAIYSSWHLSDKWWPGMNITEMKMLSLAEVSIHWNI
jgi:hypothetical protein